MVCLTAEGCGNQARYRRMNSHHFNFSLHGRCSAALARELHPSFHVAHFAAILGIESKNAAGDETRQRDPFKTGAELCALMSKIRAHL